MRSLFTLAVVVIQLMLFSAAVEPQPQKNPIINRVMSTSATSEVLGTPIDYKVDGTRVSLQIHTSPSNAALPDRELLMCIIEGIGALEETIAGDPIEDNKLTFTYSTVQIVLDDQGSPTGRFLNDIASWSMRGIAEWMTKNEHFREMSVGVYYNQYFCGLIEVKNLPLAGVEATTAKVATSTGTPI